jgi:ABC-type dipeptide/oligopeptide/nickel transport system permease component
MLSVELTLSAAIIEIVLGVLAGNLLGLTSTPWIDFLAQLLPKRATTMPAVTTETMPEARFSRPVFRPNP